MTRRLSRPFVSKPVVSPMDYQIQLLTQDFNLKVVPYQQNLETYRLSIEGAQPHLVNRSLALGWNNRGGTKHFVRTVASALLMDQEVWIEVVPHCGREREELFRVVMVAGVRKDSSGTLIQELTPFATLPEWYREDEPWDQPVTLDSSRMVHVSLPEAYPRKLLNRVLLDLAEVDSALAPEWVMQQMAGELADAPRFDQKKASRLERHRIFQVSLPIGWTARESLHYQPWEITYYYYLLRELQFLHFVSSMRERSEVALRQVLDVAGGLCDFTTSITTHGICAPEEVRSFIRKFKKGELSFATVKDILYQEASANSLVKERAI